MPTLVVCAPSPATTVSFGEREMPLNGICGVTRPLRRKCAGGASFCTRPVTPYPFYFALFAAILLPL